MKFSSALMQRSCLELYLKLHKSPSEHWRWVFRTTQICKQVPWRALQIFIAINWIRSLRRIGCFFLTLWFSTYSGNGWSLLQWIYGYTCSMAMAQDYEFWQILFEGVKKAEAGFIISFLKTFKRNKKPKTVVLLSFPFHKPVQNVSIWVFHISFLLVRHKKRKNYKSKVDLSSGSLYYDKMNLSATGFIGTSSVIASYGSENSVYTPSTWTKQHASMVLAVRNSDRPDV